MDAKIYSIALGQRSAKSDYACADGEIAGAVNLRMEGGALVPLMPGSRHRLPAVEHSPFSDGVLQVPPSPEVEFALLKSVVGGWHIHPDMLPSKVVDAPAGGKDFTPGESDWGEKAMDVLADFEHDACGGNLFTQPFLAIAACRLADGRHMCPSLPVLMIPNSGAPMVEGSSDFSVSSMKMNVVEAACRLQWRVRMPVLPERWRDVVTHLDVFVSDPVWLYKPGGRCKGFHREESTVFTHSIDSSGVAGEHRVYAPVMAQCWRAGEEDEAMVALRLMGISTFRQISSVALSDVEELPEFSDVPFNRGGLPVLASLEEYTPDYGHLSEVRAGGHSSFSGRVTAWNLHLVPPPPPGLSSVAPYATAPCFPRWVFVADPDAREYLFSIGGEECSVPLRRHGSLRGAFFWGGFGSGPERDGGRWPKTESPDRQESGGVAMPGWIWRSVKGDPEVAGSCALFPDGLLMRLDVGEVIAVCRAFRASGLVATTAPTAYAFTSEGVFLLKEMDDGVFRDAGLICAYRLRDAASLELLPLGVRFVTDMGEVVTIEGTCVSIGSGGDALPATDDAWKEFFPEEWEVDGPGFAVGGGWGAFVTRPLKLSAAEEWKRLSGVSVRVSGGCADGDVAVYGSADMCRWFRIAMGRGRRLEGLWSPKCRFYRVAARMRLQEGTALQGLGLRIRPK